MMKQDKEHKYALLDQLKSDRYTGEVPPEYLKNLEQKKWIADQGQPSGLLRKLNLPKFYIGRVAAAILIVLGSYFTFQQFQSSETQQALFAEITETELIDYAIDNVDDFNTDLLWESLNLVDHTTLIEVTDLETLESIDLEDVEFYLLQETL